MVLKSILCDSLSLCNKPIFGKNCERLILKRLKTIYALSSGSLPAAIAVVRITGKESEYALRVLTGQNKFQSLQMFYTKLYDHSGNILDRAMACYMKGPKTFTGEDSAELYLHGSRAVVNAVFSTLGKIPGIESAKAGEFSKRAYFNGKMNALQVETLSELISAENESQRVLALRIEHNGKYLRPLRQRLVELAARLEAHIDFGEEMAEGATIQQNELKKEALEIERDLRNFEKSARRGTLIRTGINVALVGRTNVGKSSLINKLAQQEIAIVSNIPGTTRDNINLRLQLKSTFVNFTDTAGIRETRDVLESEGIRRSIQKSQEANVVIFVLDQHNINEIKTEIHFLLKHICFNHTLQRLIICLNKSDLCAVNLPKISTENITSSLRQMLKNEYNVKNLTQSIVWTSCLCENGVEPLISALEHLIVEDFLANSLLTDSAADGNDFVLSSNRHCELLVSALSEMEEFLGAINEYDDIALAAHHLRLCAMAIGEIAGDIVNQEVLDQLFSTMCIGK